MDNANGNTKDTQATRYTLIYRPPSTWTLPRAGWTLVERPSYDLAAFAGRPDLPVSAHRFGVVTFDRELTADEIASFELEIVNS